MRELSIAIGLLLLLGLFGLATLYEPSKVLLAGQRLMLWSFAVALPFELAYFAALGLVLRRKGPVPRWYLRSFDHHARLTPSERWWVLPWFTVGTLAMAASVVGVVVVLLGALASLRSG
jgi:hypothetical protein